jgi:lisH domain-containing protein FOPNL
MASLKDTARRMSSIEELRDAMKENLEQSGTLRRVKAELRADVMRSLRGEDVLTTKPELSPEALVINGV